MAEIPDVIDRKYEEAQELFFAGNDSLNIDSSPQDNLRYEMICLDCEQGEAFRYIVSRPTLDTTPLVVDEGIFDCPQQMTVTHQLVKIPRTPGDARRFEDLPPEALRDNGNLVLIDTVAAIGVEVTGKCSGVNVLDADALRELAEEISGLRVVERLSLDS